MTNGNPFEALRRAAAAKLLPKGPAAPIVGDISGTYYIVRDGERQPGNWLLSGPWTRHDAERDARRCLEMFGPCRIAPAAEVRQ